MTAAMCPLIYDRILPDSLEPEHVRCTYIEGHNARCSWETLKVIDDAAREHVEEQRGDAPVELSRMLQLIEQGKYDRYLELILAVGHDRKRTRRKTFGFPRRTA